MVHYEQIASVIDAHKAAPQAALISRLNPIIRGWANYYATVISKVAYSDIDDLMYQKLNAWAKRRHPKKNGEWVSKRYWQSIGGDNWVFATKEEGLTPLRLLNHADTAIVRYVKVKGESSPYDGNLVYWSTRMGKNPEMPTKVAILLKRQKGKCTHCDLFFRENDVLEVDHKIPKSQGGKDIYDNMQLLHRHCHDTKTANDGSPGIKSGCNSAEPKPTRKLERVQDKWVMRYV
jgi:RNA-directed DNA polymerase